MTLSKRQREVLSLMCEGLTNALIAERLGISVRTVKVHVSDILTRMGVENRAQAIVKELTT